MPADIFAGRKKKGAVKAPNFFTLRCLNIYSAAHLVYLCLCLCQSIFRFFL